MRLDDIYFAVLRRAPNPTEQSYWLDFARAGGTESDIRADLSHSCEFELELRTVFWEQHRRLPTVEDVIGCRALVAAGKGIEQAAADVARKEIISGLLKVG